MKRRQFNRSLAALWLSGAAQAKPRQTMVYSAVGPRVVRYELDTASATLSQRETITLPSAIQYAWKHPTRPILYLTTSDAPGGTVGVGHLHRLCALGIGPDGVLAPLGQDVILTERPIHNSVDGRGEFVLVAYNNPAKLTVHPINPDGSAGEPLVQHAQLDVGIFPHQIRTLPANRSAVLVTRGNNAKPGKPEDPGALKIFKFDRGQLSPLADIRVGNRNGLGYGPRHLDFHPHLPAVYVSLERENQLHMHRIEGESFSPEPLAILPTAAHAGKPGQTMVGAIHVHPRGHVVYAANRASETETINGRKIFAGGENSIAVFAIDPVTGIPSWQQAIDPQGFYVRTFAIDPSGRILIAASLDKMLVREGDSIKHVSAGLSLFRIAPDGSLSFARKFDVETGIDQQMWVGAFTV